MQVSSSAFAFRELQFMPKGNCVTEADSDYCVKVEMLVRALFEDCRKKKQGNVIKAALRSPLFQLIKDQGWRAFLMFFFVRFA